MKRSTDVRVVRTQTALLESLEELLKTKKLSCITITELCSLAKINRNTFYYHYNNIFELLDEHKMIMIDDITSILEENKKLDRDSLIKLCKSIRRHPHFLNIIISPNCDLDFFNEIFKFATQITSISAEKTKKDLTPRDLLLCAYNNAGANEILRVWIMNGMKESPEEVADVIWEVSKRGVFTLLFPGERFN